MPRQASPRPPPSRLFAHGGYAVMRSGWDATRISMIVDVGPLGCTVSGGHGHADLLEHPVLRVRRAVPGRPGHLQLHRRADVARTISASTAAHSTVTVDGIEPGGARRTVRLARRPRARLREWHHDAGVRSRRRRAQRLRASGDASHPPAARAVRQAAILVVIDDLTGTGAHTVELSFQFAPLPVDARRDAVARARPSAATRSGRAVRHCRRCVAAIRSGELEPIRGWISPDYGHEQPRPCSSARPPRRCRCASITVLLPDARSAARAPPDVQLSVREHGHLIGVRHRASAAVQTRTTIASLVKAELIHHVRHRRHRQVRSRERRGGAPPRAGCATRSRIAAPTATGVMVDGRSASRIAGSPSWTSPAASSRWQRGRHRSGSSSTARSTTTPSCVAELEARGHRYRTRCDTETILHLYEEEGERVVERLHGMFAFAIWDAPRQRLLLARDRLGIKPLYYACTDHRDAVRLGDQGDPRGRRRSRRRSTRARCPSTWQPASSPASETFFRGVTRAAARPHAELVARRRRAAAPLLAAAGAGRAGAALVRGARPTILRARLTARSSAT